MKITSSFAYSICATLALGVIPAVFYTQPAHAVETERTERIVKNAELTEDMSQGKERAEKLKQNTDGKTINGKTIAAEKKASRVARLDAKKLELCKKKQEKINLSIQRVASQGINQIDVFKTIADRTMTFYVEKGNTVANYDKLVAEVNAKYEAAKVTVDTINTSSTFDCAGDNPKEALMNFRDTHKQKTAALKEYKTAIKNLIVAVKSAQEKAAEPQVEAR